MLHQVALGGHDEGWRRGQLHRTVGVQDSEDLLRLRLLQLWPRIVDHQAGRGKLRRWRSQNQLNALRRILLYDDRHLVEQ